MKKFIRAILPCCLTFNISMRAGAEEKIITLAPGRDASATVRLIENMGGRYLRSLGLINAIVVDLPIAKKTAALRSAPDVVRIEDDLYIQWVTDPSASFVAPLPDETKGSPAAKEIPWGVGAVNAPDVWQVTEGDGVKIAILDSGIDFKHPDLAGNYAGGYNTFDPMQPPFDDSGHGTKIAGVVAAVRNLTGVVGVAPKARLYAIKVLDKIHGGKISGLIAGLQWAVENKVDIVNLSFGTPKGTPALEQAINAAVKKGLTLVCAVGNVPGPVNYPAKYEAVIAVTASDIRGRVLDVASAGPEVDFIAPGVDIKTTSMNGSYEYYISGTSFAAPHVTGLAALAVALGIKGPDAIRSALTRSARSLNLSPSEQGAGLIDAATLLKLFGPYSQATR